jgi:hypothetical protein
MVVASSARRSMVTHDQKRAQAAGKDGALWVMGVFAAAW